MIKSVLTPGTTLHGKMDYTISHCLAQGGFGITYLAKGVLKIDNIVHEVPFAIKEFYIEQSCQRATNGEVVVYPSVEESVKVHKERFLNEAERLHNMKHHKGIVSVNEVFKQNNTIYYVMKYLGDMSLTQYVTAKGGTLNEKEATEIFVDVAKALQHLHSLKITHLDVKPNNIMMEDGSNPVLIDFGVSLQYGRNNLPKQDNQMICCSDGYSPLEQYSGIASFSQEADIYALGATLLYMLTGKTPPAAADMDDSYFNDNIPQDISPTLNNALRKCMAKQPEKRFHSIEELLVQICPDNAAPVDDADKTRVVGVKEYNYNKRLNNKVSWKKIGAATAFVLPIFVLSYFLLQLNIPSPSENQNEAIADTAEIVDHKDAKEEAQEANKTTKEEARTAKEEAAPTKKEEEQAQARKEVRQTESIVAEAATVTEDQGKLDLGYAEYEGKIRNGKPHGRGTLVFKASHAIGSSDKEAAKGEKVIGSFISGEFTQGKWYKNDGTVEFLIIGN